VIAPSRTRQSLFAAAAVAALALVPHAGGAVPADPLNGDERAWLKSHGEIVLAPQDSAAPYAYVDESGLVHGLSIEYLALISEATGLHFTIAHPSSSEDNLRRAREHEVDVVANIAETPERRTYLAFSQSYFRSPAVLVLRRGIALPDGIASMHGRIAVGRGDPAEGYLAQRFPALTLVPEGDETAALRDVAAGKVDGAVADAALVSQLTRDPALANLRIAYEVGLDYEIAFGYRRDWPLLGRILDKGLARISVDQRRAIAERWVRPERAGMPSREFGYALSGIAALAAIVAIVLFALYRTLRRLVDLRTRELSGELAERIRIQDELRRLADCDALTGLPNRMAFDREFERTVALARRNDTMLAVLFIDLDAFKIINDTHGHDIGDHVLQAVAERLMSSVRSSDLVSRRGGDEFVVALVDVGTESAALAVAHKILAEVARAAANTVPDFDLGCSIGISFFPSGAASAEELLRRADSAMYHGKTRGKNRVWLFRDGTEGVPGDYTVDGDPAGKPRPGTDPNIASDAGPRRAIGSSTAASTTAREPAPLTGPTR
jgi:diguanylate cyclase (GGDEF)-like protein